jgi:hypothetical protein
MISTPIACTLTDAALRKRRAGILTRMAGAVRERRDLAEGIAFRFDADGGTLAQLAEVIDLERQCCAFLRFRLTVEPEGGPVWLEMTGPEGTREFVTALFE